MRLSLRRTVVVLAMISRAQGTSNHAMIELEPAKDFKHLGAPHIAVRDLTFTASRRNPADKSSIRHGNEPPVRSCCACRNCDGCWSVPSSGAARRLSPRGRALTMPSRWLPGQTRAAVECCRFCGLSRLRPLATQARMSGSYSAPNAALKGRSALVVRLETQVEETVERERADQAEDVFEVVTEFRTREARQLFTFAVAEFAFPTKRKTKKWPATAQSAWTWFRHRLSTEVMRRMDNQPVLAMKGGVPCAGAFFTRRNNYNAYYVPTLIRNGADFCAGSGAVILCYLIRNSKSRNGKFSPLRLLDPNFAGLQPYFESMGCVKDVNQTLLCSNPSPQKCDAHGAEVVMAEQYFAEELQSNLDAQASLEFMSITVLLLVGLFGGIGITLSILYLRCADTIVNEKRILAA